MKKVVKDAEKLAKNVVSDAAEKVTAEAKEAPKTVKKTTARAAKAVAKTAKDAAGIVEEKTKEVTTATKKAVAASKSTTRRSSIKETVYLQYLGKEINKEEPTDQVKEIWTSQLGRKASELKTITWYLKPEENKAYYVINNDVTGSIAL
jgi:hypothetical protein